MVIGAGVIRKLVGVPSRHLSLFFFSRAKICAGGKHAGGGASARVVCTNRSRLACTVYSGCSLCVFLGFTCHASRPIKARVFGNTQARQVFTAASRNCIIILYQKRDTSHNRALHPTSNVNMDSNILFAEANVRLIFVLLNEPFLTREERHFSV